MLQRRSSVRPTRHTSHAELAAVALVLLLTPSLASAKDLRGRLGMGATAAVGSTPSLSLRYGLPTGNPAVNVQIEAIGGVWAVANGPTTATVAGRLLYGVVAEDNMNLFVGGGAGIDSNAGATTVLLQPVMGADFFLFGLENLGFTAEWGVDFNLGDANAVRTRAALGGGVHYWF